MATTEELLQALEDRILEAITTGKTAGTIRDLTEARAWLLAPDAPHGGQVIAG